jgi:hypothetical protein
MPVAIRWPEIASRLALAVLGGTLLGINRNSSAASRNDRACFCYGGRCENDCLKWI